MSKKIIYLDDAIDALSAKPWACAETKYNLGMKAQWESDVETLKNLPSAQPDCTDCIMHGGDWDCDHVHYRKGHWIKRFYTKSSGESLEMHVCSKCRQEYSYDAETGESEYNFCPNCGSDNRGKQK